VKLFSSKRLHITLAVAAFLGLIIGLTLGFLPEGVRRLTLKQLAAVIDAPVQIEDVDLNLFTRRAAVRGFTISDPRGGRPLVRLPRIEFEFRYLPLLQRRVVVSSLKLTLPQVAVERLEDNRFNLLEIIRTQKNDSGGVDVEIGRLEIEGGEVRFSDRMIKIPDEYRLSQIRLETGKISTGPDPKPIFFNVGVNLHPGRISAKGTFAWLGEERGVDVSVQWNELNPEIFLPYIPLDYRLEFTKSFINGDARYSFKQTATSTTTHRVEANGELGPVKVMPLSRDEPLLVAAGLKLSGLRLDLVTNHLTLAQVAISNPNLMVPPETGQAILQSAEVQLTDGRWDFSANRLGVGNLILSSPELRVERGADGQINLNRYISGLNGAKGATTDEKPVESGKPPLAVELQNINVNGGTLNFSDLSVMPPAKAVISSWQAGIENFSLAKNAPAAKLVTNGNLEKGTLRLDGAFTVEPLNLKFVIAASRLPVGNFRGYIDPALPGGRLETPELNGKLNFALTSHGEKGVGFDLAGHLETPELTLRLLDDSAPVLSTKKVRAEIDRLKTFPQLEMDFKLLRFENANIEIERQKNGGLNLAGLTRNPKEADGSGAASEPGKGPTLKIRRLEISRAIAKWTDRSVKPEVKADLQNLRATVTDFSPDPMAKPGALDVAALVNGAPLSARGAVGFEPFSVDLDLSTKGLALKTFRGYLDAGSGGLETRDGELTGAVKLSLKSLKNNTTAIDASGKLAGDRLVLGVQGESEPLLVAKNLSVEVTRLSTQPVFQLELAGVALSQPELRLELNPKGELNLKKIIDGAGDSDPKAKEEITKSEPSRMEIGKLEINEGGVRFVDRSVKPVFQTELSEIFVEMGRAGAEGERTPLKLQARLAKSGGIEIGGWFTPFQTPFKIELDGKVVDYDLSQLNPYAAKFIQYEIRRGRVSTDVGYSFDAGNLDGENEIAIRHLQLGERLGEEFEKQVGIPLKFALALLEDTDGRIRLQIPVSGDLNNPDFSLAGVVWKAVRNAFISLLTAPFRLLGNVLTVGGKITEVRIDPVQFMPGSSTPDKKAEEQLKKLAEFLGGKPSLEIEIRGTSTLGELPEIKKQRLQREIQQKAGETYEQALLRTYIARGGRVSPGRTPTMDQIENLLAIKHKVTEEDLRALASDRKKAVANRLLRLGVDQKRIFEVSDKPLLSEGEPHGQVTFELLY